MKDPRIYLAHILESILRIEKFTSGGKEAFLNENMIQDAVMRNLEIMGEAAKRVPESYRETHLEIPWKKMATFRDVLIHGYEKVMLESVWRVVRDELPGIKTAIQSIIPSLEQLEKELSDENR